MTYEVEAQVLEAIAKVSTAQLALAEATLALLHKVQAAQSSAEDMTERATRPTRERHTFGGDKPHIDAAKEANRG